MALVYRSTVGRRLTVSEGDGNIAHLGNATAVSVKNYGAVGDGVTDDTAAILAFFNSCIDNNLSGHISAGTYLITPGQLVLDTTNTNKAWPNISTDGYNAVTFKSAGGVDAPILSITNGTATSSTFKGWHGGSLGGLTFLDETGDTATSRHGLLLRGIEGTKFGYMKGTTLRADTIRIEQKLFGGTNPDPYNILGCEFKGIEADTNAGMAFNNDNGVGLSHNTIRYIRATSCVGGVMRGFGTNNKFELGSAGNCSGWAIDDAGVASLSRVNFGLWELHNVENGIRINDASAVDLGALRFVHKYQTSPNVGAFYWPLTAVSLGYTASPNVSGLTGHITHRIDAGGSKVDVGALTDFNSAGANINSVDLSIRMSDNAAFGFVDTDYYTGLSAASVVSMRLEGRPLVIQMTPVFVAVATNSTATVPNSGFGTSSSKITFSTETYDRGTYYDNVSTYAFSVPITGVYRMSASLSLALDVGTRVRMRFTTDDSGSLNSVLDGTYHSVSTSSFPQTFNLSGMQKLTAGLTVWLMADQNTTSSVWALNGGITLNHWEIESIGVN